MKKEKINVGVILKDGLILFAISTALVVIANAGFDLLKGKGVKDDPLVTAIHQNKLDQLKKHLGSGNYALDILDGHKRTALMQAAYANYSLPKRLLEADEKRAPMVAILIEKGAPLEAKDSHGWTALMWASWSGMKNVVDELLKANASHKVSGKNGYTPLTLAAMRGNAAIVKMLLSKADAGISLQTKKGQTALDLAKAGVVKYPEKEEDYKIIISLLEGQ